MHIKNKYNDITMSCLSAKVSVFNEHISANAVLLNENIRARSDKVAGISAFADIIGESIKATSKVINEGIKATYSLICTVGDNKYLFVSPDYVWLTPEMLSGEFDIMSNTDWIIK